MTTPIDEVWLSHGIQANEDIASFAAYSPGVLPDGTIQVKLAIKADAEYKHRLHPGDTFPIRDQIWKLDRVENPDKPNWEVRLVRVS